MGYLFAGGMRSCRKFVDGGKRRDVDEATGVQTQRYIEGIRILRSSQLGPHASGKCVFPDFDASLIPITQPYVPLSLEGTLALQTTELRKFRLPKSIPPIQMKKLKSRVGRWLVQSHTAHFSQF